MKYKIAKVTKTNAPEGTTSKRRMGTYWAVVRLELPDNFQSNSLIDVTELVVIDTDSRDLEHPTPLIIEWFAKLAFGGVAEPDENWTI